MQDAIKRVDYGLDAPGIIWTLFGLGITASVIASASPWRSSLFFTGLPMLLTGALMLLYSKVGKYSHRDRLLAMVAWQGDEQVLDVGTGRGLLAIGAAHFLLDGRVTGIDIWSQKDLSKNSKAAVLENARSEGVNDKVVIEDGDARQMIFADNSFDVILSNLVLHNIPDKAGRESACREIARVLKQGGTAIISDMLYTSDYLRVFREEGLAAEKIGPYFTSTFPPLTVVKAIKVRA